MIKNPVTKLAAPGLLSLLSVMVLLLLLLLSYFKGNRIEPDTNNLYLFNQAIAIIKNPLLGFIISLVLVALIAFLLFTFNDTFSFIRTRTVMPGILFVLFLFTSGYTIEHCSGLIGSLFLLFALWPLFASYQETEPVQRVFNSFMFLSIGSLFSFELLLLVPCLWISFFILRIRSLRVFLASLIGLLVPYVICVPILFYTENLNEFFELFKVQLFTNFSFPEFSSIEIIYMALFALFYLISLFYFMAQINADKIKTRQFMYFLFVLGFFMLAISVVKINFFANIFPLLAMTTSIVLAHYFTLNNSRFAFILSVLIIAALLVFYFLRT